MRGYRRRLWVRHANVAGVNGGLEPVVLSYQPGSPPSDGTAGGASAEEPVRAVLTLDVGEGVTCAVETSLTGAVGSWLTLSGASDCAAVRSGAVLLGWATSPEFPVAIALRQADHAWGVYELTNDAGEVVATHIPAGHRAFLTASNTLYPIWSS